MKRNTLLIFVIIVVILAGGWYVLAHRGSSSNPVTGSSSSSGTVLDYSSKGLTSVGPDIYNQTGATELILSDNSLKSLPSQMGRMTNLQVLKLNNNVLEGSLIAEVRQMSKLKTLDVSNNKMTGMPAEIGQLRMLETLDYSNNQISGLPNELANLKGNLKTFNLTGNPLTAKQISQLKASLPNTNVIF